MSKGAHTKGPWFAKRDRRRFQPHFVEALNAHVADVLPCSFDKRNDPEAAANARLIAAAPDMFEALKMAREFIANGVELGFIRMPDASTPDPAHDILPAIEAALAKASPEGEPSHALSLASGEAVDG